MNVAYINIKRKERRNVYWSEMHFTYQYAWCVLCGTYLYMYLSLLFMLEQKQKNILEVINTM